MAKKMCVVCHVTFINPCPVRVMHETRGATYPRDICPSCFLDKYYAPGSTYLAGVQLSEGDENTAKKQSKYASRAVSDFYVAVSHCVENIKGCEKCANYMKCMTLALNR